MILIYLQETINYMHKLDPNSLNELGKLGQPEIVDLPEKNLRYYKYNINEEEK